MRILFILILSGFFLRAHAADPVAYEGSVVLSSGEVMVGTICLPAFELIFVIADEEKLALPVNKISQVRFYDHRLNVNRKFIVQKISQSGSEHQALFEIVLWGDIKVYRKPKHPYANVSTLSHQDFDYYFAEQDQIEELGKFTRLLYPKIVNEMGEPMANFIRTMNLSPRKEADAIQIISFYNKSRKSNQLVAGLRS